MKRCFANHDEIGDLPIFLFLKKDINLFYKPYTNLTVILRSSTWQQGRFNL